MQHYRTDKKSFLQKQFEIIKLPHGYIKNPYPLFFHKETLFEWTFLKLILTFFDSFNISYSFMLNHFLYILTFFFFKNNCFIVKGIFGDL